MVNTERSVSSRFFPSSRLLESAHFIIITYKYSSGFQIEVAKSFNSVNKLCRTNRKGRLLGDERDVS